MLRYAITPGSLGAGFGDAEAAGLAGWVQDRCREGVEYLLLRERALPARDLLRASLLAVQVRDRSGDSTRVLVSARADIALLAGADGIHLSAAMGELSPAEVRRVLPGAVVSRSCHTVEEVSAARTQGADLVLFGPVFGKTVADRVVVQGLGLEALRAASAVGVPVLALGGVEAATCALCREAGAAGVAGIRLFAGHG